MNSIDSLFIKQAAILETIMEHKRTNSKTLRRQFLGISERALRYHLKKLTDLGFIKKRGNTKGAYYEITDTQLDLS